MIRRLPFILFILYILTVASLVFMIIVRTSVMGLRLLSMSSGSGRFLAKSYNASVILFLVILAVSVVTTIVMYVLKKKRKAVSAASHFSEEDVFENPAQWSENLADRS